MATSPLPDPLFLGKGSYGCVFIPAQPCKKPLKPSPKEYVSKVFRTERGADDEEYYNGKVKTIPKIEKYALMDIERCPVSREQFKAEFKNCGFKGKKFQQIIYPFGGVSIYNYIPVAKESFQELFSYCEPLFEGLVAFQKGHVIHQDIKPENIVYHPIKHEFRYIDFGLLDSQDTVYSFYNRFAGSDYIFYPAEYQLLGYVRELTREIQARGEGFLTNISLRRQIDNYYKFYISSIFKNVRTTKRLTSIRKAGKTKEEKDSFSDFVISLDPEQGINKAHALYDTFFNDPRFAHTRNGRNEIEWTGDKTVKNADLLIIIRSIGKMYEKCNIDLYMLGLNMLFMICETPIFDLSHPANVDIFRLVRGMIHHNPYERLTPEEALYQYKRIIQLHFSKKETSPSTVSEESIASLVRSVSLETSESSVYPRWSSPAPKVELFSVPKKKKPTTKPLKPCKSTQERNPATNRCRKICPDETHERIKNKCLKKCKPLLKRNPATGRCKKMPASAKAK